jgi:hypothetical protein
MGALRRRYSFVLNPYRDAGFTRCPKCEANTRVRQLSLVIHVENVGLVILGKTCRLCVCCEVLITHQAEIEQLLSASLGRAIDNQDFVVLGTLDRQLWRRGLAHPVAFDAVKKHMADFKAYLRVDLTPAGGYPKEVAS